MRRKQQPTEFSCGQTCVAMVAKVPVKKVIEVIGHGKATCANHLRFALHYFGFKVSKKLVKITKETIFPQTCIIIISYARIGKTKRGHHWIVRHNNKFYDPDKKGRIELSDYEKYVAYIKVYGELV